MNEPASMRVGDALDWLHEQGKRRARTVPEFDLETTLRKLRAVRDADEYALISQALIGAQEAFSDAQARTVVQEAQLVTKIPDGPDILAEPRAAVGGEQALLDLLPGLRAGDPAAGRELYERYQPEMCAYFTSRLPDRGKADDCVNEVFTRALEAFRKGHAPYSVDRWLWGIARHVLASREGLGEQGLDGDRSLAKALADDESAELPGRSAALVDATGEAAYDAVGIRQALSDVRAVIETFPAKRRELMDAFLALSLEGGHEVKGAQLAAALGKGWTAARVNRELHRVRLAIRHGMGVLAVARAARACPGASALIPQLAQQPGARLGLADVTPAHQAALAAHAEKCRACGRVFDDGQRSGRY